MTQTIDRLRNFFLLAATLAPLILTGCQKQESVIEKPLAIVSTQPAQEYSADLSSHYSAVVQPMTQVDLAFKGTGYVRSIFQVRGNDGRLRNVQEGDSVRAGTVLAQIDSSDYRVRVSQQRSAVQEVQLSQGKVVAAMAEAQAGLDQARTEFERTARLFQCESVTKPEFDAAKSRLDIAQARVDEARAQAETSKATTDRISAGLQEAELSLRDCQLRAPLDAVVLKRNVEIGSLATQGAAAFTLADARRVKVAFGVPDVQLSNLKIGQSLTVTAEAAAGKVFHGRITEISPAADPRSRVFNIEVTLPNPDRQLKIGMIASLAVGQAESVKPRVTVPLSAIVRSSNSPDGYAVYIILDESGKQITQERQVKLGEAFGHLVTIAEGIKLGDRVVTNGSTRIAGGQSVRVVDQSDSTD